MYGMTNPGKIFADELIEWLIEAGFIQSQCQISIYRIMHQIDLNFLFNLMLMIVSIGIQMKILENGLLIPWEINSM